MYYYELHDFFITIIVFSKYGVLPAASLRCGK